MKRDIFTQKRSSGFVGKVIMLLVVMCIIAALTEVRLHKKTYNPNPVTEINFQN